MSYDSAGTTMAAKISTQNPTRMAVGKSFIVGLRIALAFDALWARETAFWLGDR